MGVSVLVSNLSTTNRLLRNTFTAGFFCFEALIPQKNFQKGAQRDSDGSAMKPVYNAYCQRGFYLKVLDTFLIRDNVGVLRGYFCSVGNPSMHYA